MFYDCYANRVTLAIKILCCITSLPLDTRSSNIYNNNNIANRFFVFVVMNLSELYDCYGVYANIVTLSIRYVDP